MKKGIVQTYQQNKKRVLYVGDSLTDSLVLAKADVGCTINSSSNLTVGAAGILLIRDNLIDFWKAIMIGRKTVHRIKINFLFALIYNIVLIPVAMGVFYPFKLDPFLSAIAMALSSISVILSSLELRLYNPDVSLELKFGGIA